MLQTLVGKIRATVPFVCAGKGPRQEGSRRTRPQQAGRSDFLPALCSGALRSGVLLQEVILASEPREENLGL